MGVRRGAHLATAHKTIGRRPKPTPKVSSFNARQAQTLVWVARWVGVITACRRVRVVIGGSGRGANSSRSYGRAGPVPGTATRSAACNTGNRQRRQGPAYNVNEDRGGAVRSRQIPFQDLHGERQPITLQLRGFQYHHGVGNLGTVLAESGHGGIGWVFSEAVAALARRPFLKKVRSRHGLRPSPDGRRTRLSWVPRRSA